MKTQNKKIELIIDILKNYGCFGVSELTESHDEVVVGRLGELIGVAQYFTEDYVEINVFDASSHSFDNIHTYELNYEELPKETLPKILRLCRMWKKQSILNRTKKFSTSQNIVLTEIYRRLNYFHNGNLDEPFMLLCYPSFVKPLKEFGLVRTKERVKPRILSWYGLTEKGKSFFKKYVTDKKLSESENIALYSGTKVMSFDQIFSKE